MVEGVRGKGEGRRAPVVGTMMFSHRCPPRSLLISKDTSKVHSSYPWNGVKQSLGVPSPWIARGEIERESRVDRNDGAVARIFLLLLLKSTITPVGSPAYGRERVGRGEEGGSREACMCTAVYIRTRFIAVGSSPREGDGRYSRSKTRQSR